jgi:hypothetical protein
MSTKRRPSALDLGRTRLVLAAAMTVASMLGCELILPPPGYYVAAGGAGGGGNGGHGGSAGSAGAGGAGGVGGSAGADAGEGMPPCCSTDRLDDGCIGYPILKASSLPVLDGDCSDGAWQDAHTVPLQGEVQGTAPGTAVCRLLWGAKSIDGGPLEPTIFGCCDVTDTDVEATPAPQGNGKGTVLGEDGFEYIFSQQHAQTDGTVATAIGAKGSEAVGAYDSGGVMNVGAGADIVVTSTLHDAGDGGVGQPGYTIEWSAPLTPMRVGDELFCQFIVINRTTVDAGLPTGHAYGCGSTAGLPAGWTTCAFVGP